VAGTTTITLPSSTATLATNENFTSTGIDDNATSTAITIDSSENVGIGVTPESDIYSSYQTLQFGEAGVISCQSGNNGAVFFGNNFIHNGSNSNTGSKYIESDEASAVKLQTGQVQFLVAPSGTADNAISWTTAMTIDNSGNVATPGITLGNGTTYNAANHLDDYEEGTWTPTANGGITGISSTDCFYTKVGNIVTIQGRMHTPVNTSGTTLSFGGLPFTVADSTASALCNTTYTTISGVQLWMFLTHGGTTFYPRNVNSAGQYSSLAGTNMSGSAHIYVNATYKTNS